MDKIIYHANCSDGFCAAWLAHQVWPNAHYISAQYGDKPPDVWGMDVLIVDFSYDRATILQLKESALDFVLIDHHKTAIEDLAGLEYCLLDASKSGASLAYDWLVGYLPKGFGRPWLVDYTQDRDLWQWKLPKSKEINAALRSYPYDFKVWDELSKRDPMTLVPEGEAIARQIDRMVESHVKNAFEVSFPIPPNESLKVMAVNCTSAECISDVADTLAIGRPFGLTFFEKADGTYVYSLRSRKDGVDVAKIAQQFPGGGGHVNAAGFSFYMHPWDAYFEGQKNEAIRSVGTHSKS